MPKNILSLSSNEALDYFMKSEQFHGFELPAPKHHIHPRQKAQEITLYHTSLQTCDGKHGETTME